MIIQHIPQNEFEKQDFKLHFRMLNLEKGKHFLNERKKLH